MKIGMISLGCPKNLVDSEVMLGLGEQAGHTVTADAADADVLIVNTCAFIDRAKQESIDTILEMAELKKAAPGKRLVVTGCLAERYRDELQAQIPEIDAVLGTGEIPQIVEAVTGGQAPTHSSGGLSPSAAPVAFYRNRHRPLGSRAELPTYLYDASTPRRLATPRHYAYVKVAEGCDYTCAFCIIPRLRGHYRSRPADEIVREAQSLADRGVKELLLISQDTTFYGNDLGERGALGRLLRQLNRVDGLEWIRLLYLYPTTIDDVDAGRDGRVREGLNYIDVPLQHASDAVLKRCGAGTRASYGACSSASGPAIPGVALRTTFIVGFPGETEEDFAELSAFVSARSFDASGYSPTRMRRGRAPANGTTTCPPRRSAGDATG